VRPIQEAIRISERHLFVSIVIIGPFFFMIYWHWYSFVMSASFLFNEALTYSRSAPVSLVVSFTGSVWLFSPGLCPSAAYLASPRQQHQDWLVLSDAKPTDAATVTANYKSNRVRSLKFFLRLKYNQQFKLIKSWEFS